MPGLLLDRLWRDGPEVSEGHAVAEEAARAGEDATQLRAFALLALLRDREPLTPELAVCSLSDPVRPWAQQVLTTAATLWRAGLGGGDDAAGEGGGEVALHHRLRLELEEMGSERPPDPRSAAARAWAGLATAECSLVAGDVHGARVGFQRLARSRSAPPAVHLAASVRYALLDLASSPGRALAELDSASSTAAALRRWGEHSLGLTFGAIAAMTTGDTEGAFERLRRAAASGQGHTGGHLELANLLLAALTADPRFGASADEPFEHLAEGIRIAAQSGDVFAYQLFILASASAYQARGRPADAVATVTNGYASLEAAASGLGAALAAWLRAMEDAMGTEAFTQAHRQAQSLIEDDRRRLGGS